MFAVTRGVHSLEGAALLLQLLLLEHPSAHAHGVEHKGGALHHFASQLLQGDADKLGALFKFGTA